MFNYGLTRKQCGVIFFNVKSNNLQLPEGFSKWMYDQIADRKIYSDNTVMQDVFARMRNGLDAIFANDMEKANEELTSAYVVFRAHYEVA